MRKKKVGGSYGNRFKGFGGNYQRRGDQQAIAQLYDRTSKRAYYLAKQLVKDEGPGPRTLSRDAYVKVFTNLHLLEQVENFQGWLNTIVVNKSKDYLKKKKPMLFSQMVSEEDEGSELDFEDEGGYFSPDKRVDYTETKRLIQGMIDRLPQGAADAIVLFYLEEMPVKQIARVMECSEEDGEEPPKLWKKGHQGPGPGAGEEGNQALLRTLYPIPCTGCCASRHFPTVVPAGSWPEGCGGWNGRGLGRRGPERLPEELGRLLAEPHPAARFPERAVTERLRPERQLPGPLDKLRAGKAAAAAGKAGAAVAGKAAVAAAGKAGAAAAGKAISVKAAAIVAAACIGAGGVGAGAGVYISIIVRRRPGKRRSKGSGMRNPQSLRLRRRQLWRRLRSPMQFRWKMKKFCR